MDSTQTPTHAAVQPLPPGIVEAGNTPGLGGVSQSIKPVQIYESASCDGYSDRGDGRFFGDRISARAASVAKYGSYAAGPIPHDAIDDGAGRFYLLAKKHPVPLSNSRQAREDLAKKARAKLSSEEQEALGL